MSSPTIPWPALLRGSLLLALAWTSATWAAEAPWVQLGKDGRLVYRTDAQGNRIPDFSNCGYEQGQTLPDDVPVKAEVSPGEGDAAERIQAAIDIVSHLPLDEKGFRGAVLLKKGRYPMAGELHLGASGVVLRGEGQGESDTVLIATGTSQRSLIKVSPPKAEAGDQTNDAAVATSKKSKTGPVLARVVDGYVPVGAHSFQVDSAAKLKVGDEVIVRRPSTAEWIAALGMDHIPPRADGHPIVQWAPGSKDLAFNRVITAISGNKVTIDAPICCALEQKYGGATLAKNQAPHLTHVGLENLRGESEYHGAEDEAHSWKLIELLGAYNSWVRQVTAVHFSYSCVDIAAGSKWVTVEDCSCLDPISKIMGGRRYSFSINGQLSLVQRCFARNGRHDYVMGADVAGPNVFLDCQAEQTHADSGPHHRWSVGVLYDNLKLTGATSPKPSPSLLAIQNRGNFGTGHGWAGANQVIWNCTADQIICQQPPTAQNWAIGCTTASPSGNAYWQSKDAPVEPHSLYSAQRQERLAP